MKRVAMTLGAVAAGIVAIVVASSAGGVALGAGLDTRLKGMSSSALRSEVSSSTVELRRATRWKCTVRHAKTQNDYKCTERNEKKSCRCAIRKCKYWNPGHERHCSSACHCSKK